MLMKKGIPETCTSCGSVLTRDPVLLRTEPCKNCEFIAVPKKFVVFPDGEVTELQGSGLGGSDG